MAGHWLTTSCQPIGYVTNSHCGMHVNSAYHSDYLLRIQ